MDDFTNLIETGILDLPGAEEMSRESCSDDGDSGVIVLTMEGGRKFRIAYSRI